MQQEHLDLLQTGQQLEQYTKTTKFSSSSSLQQYAGLVSPIASGFPVTSGGVNTRANPLTTAAGGAIFGSAIPNVNPLLVLVLDYSEDYYNEKNTKDHV